MALLVEELGVEVEVEGKDAGVTELFSDEVEGKDTGVTELLSDILVYGNLKTSGNKKHEKSFAQHALKINTTVLCQRFDAD